MTINALLGLIFRIIFDMEVDRMSFKLKAFCESLISHQRKDKIINCKQTGLVRDIPITASLFNSNQKERNIFFNLSNELYKNK